MKYIVDEIVIFNSNDNSLTSARADEKGEIIDILPWPTARLLLELIKHVNNLTTREELLILVWEKHGAIPSQSNLNNHLTLLRKRFDFWGIDRKKLLSIPRKGIILKTTVKIVEDEDDKNELISLARVRTESHYPQDMDVVHPAPSPFNEKTECIKLRNPKSVISFYNAVLASMTILFFFIFFLLLKKCSYISSVPELKIEQCSIYPVKSGFIQLEEESKKSTITALNQLIREKKISCKDKKDIYVAQRYYLGKSWIYMSECKLKDEFNYSTCYGYYYSDKRKEL